jgi:hypothetical protein
MTSNSPLPWEYQRINGRHVATSLRLATTKIVPHVVFETDYSNGIPHEEAEANAKLICDAVNNYAVVKNAARALAEERLAELALMNQEIATLREQRDELVRIVEKVQRFLEVPDHKRDDVEFLRATCSIARSLLIQHSKRYNHD